MTTNYTTLFRQVWLKRGYSEACVDRMQELNSSGMSDADMLRTVKQENLL